MPTRLSHKREITISFSSYRYLTFSAFSSPLLYMFSYDETQKGDFNPLSRLTNTANQLVWKKILSTQVKLRKRIKSKQWDSVQVSDDPWERLKTFNCFRRISMSDGSNKKSIEDELQRLHSDHISVLKDLTGSHSTHESFVVWAKPEGPGILELWEDGPRSVDCQGPRTGLARGPYQPSNDTISSDLWLKEYREHDHETCHWRRQIGDITVIAEGGELRWGICFQLQCCGSMHSKGLCLPVWAELSPNQVTHAQIGLTLRNNAFNVCMSFFSSCVFFAATW